MQGGVAGFQNAPVTRAVAIACGFLSFAFLARGRSRPLGFSYQETVQEFRLLKVIPSVFAFSSVPDLVFGLYLLYYFRVFERQIGSNKYSVFVLFSVAVSSLLQILALTSLRDSSFNVGASGPYGLIFALFVQFYLDIPVTALFNFFGLKMSDKSFIYLAGLQLLFSSWKRSLVPCLCGVIAGCLYRLNILGIRRLKMPQIIVSFFLRLFPQSPVPSPSPRRNVLGNLPHRTGRQPDYQSALFDTSTEPPESSIATLVSMGFDRNAARQALVRARNDINRATNILLETQAR